MLQYRTLSTSTSTLLFDSHVQLTVVVVIHYFACLRSCSRAQLLIFSVCGMYARCVCSRADVIGTGLGWLVGRLVSLINLRTSSALSYLHLTQFDFW